MEKKKYRNSGNKKMNYKIYPLKIKHYDDVMALWKNTENIDFSETDEKIYFKYFLKRNPGLSSIAIYNRKIIGAVLCSHDGRRGYLHHLAVKKEYRRHKIGKTLVEKCLKKLAKEKIIKCNIYILEKNEPGSHFWQQQGFQLLEHFGWMQKQISHSIPVNKKYGL